MIFNGSSKIKDDGGDYIVLIDNGCEGLSVAVQKHTHEAAIKWIMSGSYGSVHTIVKLVRLDIQEQPADRAGKEDGR